MTASCTQFYCCCFVFVIIIISIIITYFVARHCYGTVKSVAVDMFVVHFKPLLLAMISIVVFVLSLFMSRLELWTPVRWWRGEYLGGVGAESF